MWRKSVKYLGTKIRRALEGKTFRHVGMMERWKLKEPDGAKKVLEEQDQSYMKDGTVDKVKVKEVLQDGKGNYLQRYKKQAREVSW